MQDKISHIIKSDKLIEIEVLTNRFTHDLVHVLKNEYPLAMLEKYETVEFNLHQVRMIDSSSIGFLFELHNKLRADTNSQLIISVGENHELRELLHKFQVDLLLTVK